MNCGRIYSHIAFGPRGLVQGLYGSSRFLNARRDVFQHVRRYRAERYRCDSFYARLRRGILQPSADFTRACARQVEFMIASRWYRCQQAGSFFLYLWERNLLQGIVSRFFSRLLTRMRQRMGRCCRETILPACAVFCWREERIPDKEVLRYTNEMAAVACLRQQTCATEVGEEKESCLKNKEKESWLACKDHFHDRVEDPWEVFIQQKDLIVWRREVPDHRGESLYEYKVNGSYDDITAVDFLAVQVDTKFRKEWDTSAVVLEVLEEELSTNSAVIYWEMQWPRPMSNRDYVYKRRYMIDKEKNVIVIISLNTEHPSAPVKPGRQRVTEYWSIIVIKPVTDLNEPGVEFSMTYFDNPGLVFPTTFTSWVTATGFPDFLSKQHDATLLFAERRLKEEKIRKEESRLAEEKARQAQEEETRQAQMEEQREEERKGHKLTERIKRRFQKFEEILRSCDEEKDEDENERLNELLDKISLFST